jgi:hypothetical protein
VTPISSAPGNTQERIINLAASCRNDPAKWARVAWDWGFGELAEFTGPRKWQAEEFAAISEHLRNPETRHTPYRAAVATGHGPGKSAWIGMLSNWALSTMADTRVIITANTEGQLRTKTAPEVGKWFRLSLTASWFDVQATSISSRDMDHAKTWRADLVPWSETNTEAFAGLHNMGRRIVVFYDEASGIIDKIWEVTDGALTDENTQIIWIAFGNPTRATGRFRECFRRFKHRWRTRQIDSRDVDGTNKEQLAEWQHDYGEDSDFFKVRVRGMFPSMSARQFISEADVTAAYGREILPQNYIFAPKILSVDPAWEGDDEFVIGIRQGLFFRILHKMAKNDNDLIAAQIIARYEDEEKADAVFVDAGYGTGIVSAAEGLGRSWTLVWFASASADAGCLNKRAQMWRDARDWLKAGGCLPEDPVLRDELQAPEIIPRIDGKIQIESKKDMKARGIPSPNRADCLIISFAFPVQAKSDYDLLRERVGGGDRRDYDPYA